MGKKSFFETLGEDYIRSAVKQVGRDGGKVISNSIYGNAHSTPIRMTSGSPVLDDIQISISNEEIENEYKKLIDNGYHKSWMGMWTRLYNLIISFILQFIPIIGIIWTISFISVSFKYFKKNISLVKKDVIKADIVSDRRCRNGYRINGYHKEDDVKYFIAIADGDKKKCIIMGFIYLFVAIICSLFRLSLFAILLVCA